MEELDNILNKFTYHFKKVLISSQNLAFAKKHSEIEALDLLISLVSTKGALGSEILNKKNIQKIINAENNLTTNILNQDPSLLPQPSADVQKIIEKAVVAAFKHQHKYVGTEHLLWGLSESENPKIKEIWQKIDSSSKNIQQHLELVLKGTSKFGDLAENIEKKNELESILENENLNSFLESFAIDLTNQEIQNDIDPVIGRQNEIDRLIQILSRRTKNNPVLLGDAGVGKTAIIEGLAKRITLGQVPDILLNKKILSLDLSSIIAGTMYRGEFESRLKQIIDEAKKDKNIIIFIDELHNIMGAGSTGGSLDAANILKPALARGQLRCIGATTFEEYKKYIESDKALERRFQAIAINEPSEIETYQILQGLKENYEKFHKVQISEEALQAAIELSQKFLPDKKLPDKAIDLIDEAAAKFKLKTTKNSLIKKIKDLESEINLCQKNKQEAIYDENYLQAIDYKNKEEILIDKLLKLKAVSDKSKYLLQGEINAQEIKEVVAKITGIPLSTVSTSDKNKLIQLENNLGKTIFGQEKATTIIASTIRKSKAGLHDENKPLASFMFLGPSGVGKTEMAKQLAKNIFGSSHNLLRIDMSEFAESFNISKLIGAPAGYVGYKESNKLSDVVKNRPHTLILFDEIEKAHSDVFNLLLPILEEGELTDATGRVVNFRNCIIVMTSNVGLNEFNQQAEMGFESSGSKQEEDFVKTSQKILETLPDYFPPEFLNRIDNIVVFEPIDKLAAQKIIKREIESLRQKLLVQNINLELDPKIIKYLLSKQNSLEDGARALKKLVDTEVTNNIASAILKASRRKLSVTLNRDKIVIK
ncbi:ATP-dependent Clp protease ATP-binding subunit [Candidatus Nomurabacteria bacterium]|nr:ATP-dependent Clp protease ATP-binding subunit [Candidatus Nomurabacteria bacterium]